MVDFFYWNKGRTAEGFTHLSVYLKTPSNGRPGWYFATAGAYPITSIDRSGSRFRRMPVRFGIHHPKAQPNEAHKPTKMGNPGDYLVQGGSGGYQIVNEHEYSLRNTGKSTDLPGQKVVDATITIEAAPTGLSSGVSTPPPSMGGGY